MRLIRDFDLYGHSFDFYFENKNKNKTTVGGLVSLVLIGGLLRYIELIIVI